ncbi:hypothetical protein LCGC14_0278050 [marine sediment metagenome]|uniref:Uncharacterized protein n=1 Tax=marine sediment metagenome TaxID=412755 RepID=A0A0F9U1Q5_9ZZZZ
MKKKERRANLIKQIVCYRNHIKTLQDETITAETTVRELLKELQGICPHKHVREENEYVAGGYLHKAKYTDIQICTVCEKEVSRVVTYGGFE